MLERIIAEAINDHCPLIILHSGNPSVENIVKRGYVRVTEDRRLIPTNLGRALIEGLEWI